MKIQEMMLKIQNNLLDLHAMTSSARSIFASKPGKEEHPIISDLKQMLEDYQLAEKTLQSNIALWVSMKSLEASSLSLLESRLGIVQNRSLTKLTQLAFVFIPSSFVASIFGMNIDLLSGAGAKWWTALVGIVIVYVLLAVPMGLFWGKEHRETIEKLKEAKRLPDFPEVPGESLRNPPLPRIYRQFQETEQVNRAVGID
jgi:Mg2+ and Co2+ transporter CorA